MPFFIFISSQFQWPLKMWQWQYKVKEGKCRWADWNESNFGALGLHCGIPQFLNHKNIYWLVSIFILLKSDISYREESETPESLGP